jgi:hypothetical protein
MNGCKIRQMLLSTRSVALFCVVFWCPYGHAVEQEATEHEQEHEGSNEIAISLGVVHEGRENDAAAGLEYERRFSESFGAGLLIERSWGDHSATVYALPLIRHIDRWKLFAALGIEDSHGHSENMVRIGAGYELPAGSGKVTPALAVDFVGGETIYVLSVSLGFSF